ncbi:CTLH/CRA C-terminal to lish motif domain-containing protein [Dipodascopsis uninucleata]
MEGVTKEFKKLESGGKFNKYISDVNEILSTLEKVRSTIDSVPQSRREQLAVLKRSATGWNSKINESQKEIHSALSKYGKSLDKKFKTDIEAAYNPNAFPRSTDKLLERAIAMHLIREGQFEVADKLIRETDLNIPPELEDDFIEMYKILESIKKKDLTPAIEWAASRREQLVQIGSNLEFNLHHLQFVYYFINSSKQNNHQALEYARENLSSFGERYLQEISKLMCALLFQDNLENSPYSYIFLNPSAWDDVAHSFTKEFCSLMGLSPQSPLYLAAVAGTIALPTLLKMGSIMREKQTEWSSENELPVEVPLPPSFQFHSIFVCPVSKEQTTDENPPMMMPCGHIVAKDSLTKMSKGNPQQRFKCPYCPNESIPNQAIRVYFG